jgi:anaerobic ribonucleoside-triphosphate reductase
MTPLVENFVGRVSRYIHYQQSLHFLLEERYNTEYFRYRVDNRLHDHKFIQTRTLYCEQSSEKKLLSSYMQTTGTHIVFHNTYHALLLVLETCDHYDNST